MSSSYHHPKSDCMLEELCMLHAWLWKHSYLLSRELHELRLPVSFGKHCTRALCEL